MKQSRIDNIIDKIEDIDLIITDISNIMKLERIERRKEINK